MVKVKLLSKEEQELRKPIPPAILIDALQDPIHIEVGNSRRAYSSHAKKAKLLRRNRL